MAPLRTNLSSTKIRQNSFNMYTIVNLALLLDSGFGQVLPVNSSNWPFSSRESTECIKTGTVACEPITAPGCRSRNMLVSSLRAVAPPRGQSSRHQAQGHQNPRTHHITSLSPFVTQGFCEFLSAGTCPKDFYRNTEDISHRSRLSKCRTLSTSIFGHALFRDILPHSSRNRNYLFQNSFIIVCQEFCQCAD